jgi:hypothetical protein
MRLRRLFIPLALLTAAIAFGGHALAKGAVDEGKTLLTDGLLQPRGIKAGPDGMLYVAEAGTGGDTKVDAGGGMTVFTGNTGRISKIDPATGKRTTVLDGIPSEWGGNPNDDPSANGIADIAFLDNTLYYLSTGGESIFPGHPAGIYKVTINNKDLASDSAKLLADIGAFTAANPVGAVRDKTQGDVDPNGNPYSMIVRGRSFYVVDGNQNQVVQVTEGGSISRLADFNAHVVSTGIASKEDGPLFVSTIGQDPFLPQDGRVYQVGFPTGNIVKIAGGVSFLTGLAFGPGGQLYANSFAEPADDPNGPPIKFGTGGIFKVNDDGTLSAVITGFTAGTTFTFVGDTAYVLNDSLNAFGTGEVWKVENFSSIVPQAPAAPEPTAVPPIAEPPAKPVAITPPNTGSGPSAAGNSMLWLMSAAVAALGAFAVAGGVAAKRR